MTHWRSLIERDFLGAWDLKGREHSVTIERVESRGVHDRKKGSERRKCVIYFKGHKKALIANATICEAIEGIWGQDFEGWVGKRITIRPTVTTVAGKSNIPCVRVKPVAPTAAVPDTAQSLNEPVDPEMRKLQDSAFGREPGEEG